MHVTETHTNTKPKQFCTSHTQIRTPKSNMKYLVNFLTCAPLAHVEVQRERERERERDRKEEMGGGAGVNECNGRARARERKTQLTISKQLPLATALAQPVPYWPADSPHHNPM